MNISFLGSGRWGLTLALLLCRKGLRVACWEKNPERLAQLRSTRRVPDLPETAVIPDSLILTGDPAAALARADVAVLALPSQALRANLEQLKGTLARIPTILSVMKGIETGTLKRVSEIIRQYLPANRVAVLTGPGIPYDVANGDPTSLLVAAAEDATAAAIRDTFAFENLRIYSGTDLVGAELGGALKNVMAIAAGLADGIGLGINAKAALLTRGLYEITRLGTCLGANPLTFAGLSGVGDLIVTAFSPKSRNFQFGQAIARGVSVPDTIASLTGVAEGYYTTQAAHNLANRFNVELPITSELHHILYEAQTPKDSIKRLLSRSLKAEQWS